MSGCVCGNTWWEKSLWISEWNTRLSVSDLSSTWRKKRPDGVTENLLFLVYNIESLNTHEKDLIILLDTYNPHVCVLTGVGTATRIMPTFPGYRSIAQSGSNAFGAVAIIHRNALKCRLIERDVNALIVEIAVANAQLKIGAIYVPQKSPLPLDLLNKYKDEPFVYFGDYNAKHSYWNCLKNNTTGNELSNWVEQTGMEVIAPTQATSRRSEATIDFGLTHDAQGWQIEVLEEGTSDHKPILFQSSYCAEEEAQFKATNWNMFTYFLSVVVEYWKAVVQNMDPDSFVELLSLFLTALWDRCSVYKRINEHRPPWPESLVLLAKETNRARRKYRRTKELHHLQSFLSLKGFFTSEKNTLIQTKREMKMDWIKEKKNIWKFAKPIFHAFSPPFKGLTMPDKKKETDPIRIAHTLADHYEKHFAYPIHDVSNPIHRHMINEYNELALKPNHALEKISYEEVLREWKAFKPKKSTDSAETSAFLLKKMPIQFVDIVTTLFNKCASEGSFFRMAKHAKVICLSKDGLFPSVEKLRPISLLPNIGKWFERIIHKRLIRWCNENNVYTDEQSGFTTGRRLQTRILSLVEDLRQTVTACNRPALVLFVDFRSAFDNMWYPSLLSSMKRLGTPMPLLKWTFNWLRNRTSSLHFGNAQSRTISMHIGAPQGSVLAASLFRLHVHTLPALLRAYESHMFADDLAIQISRDIEKRLSKNVVELEQRASIVFDILGRFAADNLLHLNEKKTKAMLIHSALFTEKPKLEFKGQQIEYVKSFKYLGVTISTNLGWSNFTHERTKKIRNVYQGMKIAYRAIARTEIKARRTIFSAFAMPHFQWLMGVWFFFTEKQKQYIQHIYYSGLRLVFSLSNWDDETTAVLCQAKTLLDHVHMYWSRFFMHLQQSPDALCFWKTWCTHHIVIESEKKWNKYLGLGKGNKFLARLRERAKHTIIDWIDFDAVQKNQLNFYTGDPRGIYKFVYKYFLSEQEWKSSPEHKTLHEWSLSKTPSKSGVLTLLFLFSLLSPFLFLLRILFLWTSRHNKREIKKNQNCWVNLNSLWLLLLPGPSFYSMFVFEIVRPVGDFSQWEDQLLALGLWQYPSLCHALISSKTLSNRLG